MRLEMLAHTTFNIQPAFQKSPYRFTEPLIKIATAWGNQIAIKELHKYAAITTHDTWIENHCRLILPLTDIGQISLQGETITPFRLFVTEGREGAPEVGLLQYNDLSCLIFVHEEKISTARGEKWVEIIPTPVTLGSIKRSSAKELSFTSKQVGQYLKLSVTDRESGAEFMFAEDDSVNRRNVRQHQIYERICGQLMHELQSWAQILPALPCIRRPEFAERTFGIFGRTVPSPSPEVVGRTFAWPQMLPWSSHSQGEIDAMKDYLGKISRLMFVRHSSEISGIRLTLVSGRPGIKKSLKPRLKVEISGCLTKDVKRLSRKILADAINHFQPGKAPFDYTKFNGSLLHPKGKGIKSAGSFPISIIGAGVSHSITSHERMDLIVEYGELAQ